MSQRFLIGCFTTVFASLVGLGGLCHAANPAKELAQKLQETYILTKVTLYTAAVKAPGSVVVLQRDGIIGNPDFPPSYEISSTAATNWGVR